MKFTETNKDYDSLVYTVVENKLSLFSVNFLRNLEICTMFSFKIILKNILNDVM